MGGLKGISLCCRLRGRRRLVSLPRHHRISSSSSTRRGPRSFTNHRASLMSHQWRKPSSRLRRHRSSSTSNSSSITRRRRSSRHPNTTRHKACSLFPVSLSGVIPSFLHIVSITQLIPAASRWEPGSNVPSYPIVTYALVEGSNRGVRPSSDCSLNS